LGCTHTRTPTGPARHGASQDGAGCLQSLRLPRLCLCLRCLCLWWWRLWRRPLLPLSLLPLSLLSPLPLLLSLLEERRRFLCLSFLCLCLCSCNHGGREVGRGQAWRPCWLVPRAALLGAATRPPAPWRRAGASEARTLCLCFLCFFAGFSSSLLSCCSFSARAASSSLLRHSFL